MSTLKYITVPGDKSKVVGGDDNSTTINYHYQKTKLTSLFEKLKKKYDDEKKITRISDDLKRYIDKRDRIGLEQKLLDAGRDHLKDDFFWLKDQYARKLTKFQFYEPAQEIHAFLLSLVFEKFRNLIYPMIRNDFEEGVILKAISEKITNPIVELIQKEGCEDIMGLCPTDIEGMIHYLTGQCHIKWKL